MKQLYTIPVLFSKYFIFDHSAYTNPDIVLLRPSIFARYRFLSALSINSSTVWYTVGTNFILRPEAIAALSCPNWAGCFT